ncbi:MAG TPA: hypothetical protein VMU47_15155 [Caldimonas sp.]|nr:hypothetical protein [Caldimonas sp.]
MPAWRQRSVGWLRVPDLTLLAVSIFVFALLNQGVKSPKWNLGLLSQISFSA